MQPVVIKVLKTARSLATMIVIAGLSLYVYDYFKRADRQRASDEAALIREQTQVLQTQAVELNQQLRSATDEAAALKNEVAGQRAEVASDKARQLIARSLTEGLQIAQMARVAVTEAYQTNLQWPVSNAAVGLPAPEQMKGNSLRRVQIGSKGVVSLVYDEQSGVAGGSIQLIPDANASGVVSWRCQTASYPAIATFVEQCRYVQPK